jgi:hypothetical protein
MLLRVNQTLRDFITEYICHFDDVPEQEDDTVHFEQIRWMCRKMREAGIEPVDRWWPNKVVGERPQLALRKGQDTVHHSVLKAYERVFDEQYDSIIRRSSSSVDNRPISIKDEFEDAVSGGLLPAVFTVVGCTLAVYTILFYRGTGLVERVSMTLLTMFLVFIVEAYFISKRLTE